MAKIKLFKLKYCGFCRDAQLYLEETLRANPEYCNLEIEIIDEGEQRNVANTHDYYYVPTFYLNDVKIHEGPVSRADVVRICKMAFEST